MVLWKAFAIRHQYSRIRTCGSVNTEPNFGFSKSTSLILVVALFNVDFDGLSGCKCNILDCFDFTNATALQNLFYYK
jgi:hypothetical protein